MPHSEVFIAAAARTAIGSFGGALKDVSLSDLATTVLRAAVDRSGIPPEQVGHVVIGNVISTEPRDAYLGRVASMNASLRERSRCYCIDQP